MVSRDSEKQASTEKVFSWGGDGGRRIQYVSFCDQNVGFNRPMS